MYLDEQKRPVAGREDVLMWASAHVLMFGVGQMSPANSNFRQKT
jgi:hypothetical protein